MSGYNVPEPSLEPPEPDERLCPLCDEAMTDTEYEWENEWICECCFKTFVDEFTLEEIAEFIGVAVRVGG